MWDAQCKECPDKKTRIETLDLDGGLDALISLELLKSSGYPFGRDELDLTTWLALGAIREERENAKASWQIKTSA